MYKRLYAVAALLLPTMAATYSHADEDARKVVLLPSPFGTTEVTRSSVENPKVVAPQNDEKHLNHSDTLEATKPTASDAVNASHLAPQANSLEVIKSPEEVSKETDSTKNINSPSAAAPVVMPAIKPQGNNNQTLDTSKSIAAPPDLNAPVPEETNHALNQQLNTLKSEVIGISQEIESLEESLMAPHDNQLNAFLSIESTPGFELESLSLSLNNKVINRHLYNEREMKALKRGAVQRLFNTAILNGEHELVATIKGTLDEKPYSRDLVITFEKGASAKYVQLDIKRQIFTKEPAFQFRTWE